MMMKDGYQMGCLDIKCMWWTGAECAVTQLSRQLVTGDLQEADTAQIETCTE
jgi:hypothetical protein